MGIKRFKPVTPAKRHAEVTDFDELTTDEPEKSLLEPLKKSGGRNNQGKETVRGRSGGHKRKYRKVDFLRDKEGIKGKVVSREYDPNRSAWITLLLYADGERRYIISPLKLEVGDMVEAGDSAEVRPGNAIPLRKIPAGRPIHNLEFSPGSGGKIARSAGVDARIVAKDPEQIDVKLPSGEIRTFSPECKATVGQVSNPSHKNVKSGKAGRSRHLGRKPKVRGVAKNAVDHPHGGGEGKAYVGRPPVSSTGVPAKGGKTRKSKKSDKKIIKRRTKKKRG
ncbi:50S ribosomal protein L2 [Candidatus Bipolaricaulota bacterium]|nr:50S ribosomal protein L2 [Candidatus Bipolaricaulota bacterium]MBS3813808.1 50S ribosomal protein L2 [Candidatus Bipolaricaulota bacterium]MBS3824927.1 50S ribosomal protein L2 [Candidatus Bipolaricaulota bacterium]